jgi:hypothetical protein
MREKVETKKVEEDKKGVLGAEFKVSTPVKTRAELICAYPRIWVHREIS